MNSECEICNKEFMTKHGLHVHYGRIHPEYEYEKGGTRTPKQIQRIMVATKEAMKNLPPESRERMRNKRNSFLNGLTERHRDKISRGVKKYRKEHPDALRGKNNPAWKGGSVTLVCEICENSYVVSRNKKNRSRTCSIKCQDKLHSIEMRGENNPNFKGWSSREPYGKEWSGKLKEQIRKRDGYMCVLCKTITNSLHKIIWGSFLSVHHVNGDKKDCSPKNLLTLCKICHQRLEKS